MFDLQSRATFALAAGLAVSLIFSSPAQAVGANALQVVSTTDCIATACDFAGEVGTNQDPSPERASLQVDVSALGNKGKPLANQVQSRADALLRELEFLPAREANDLLILVKITGLESEPGYHIEFSGLRAGQPQDSNVTVADCRLCTDGEVVDLFAARLREYLAHAREKHDEVASPSESKPDDSATKASLAPQVNVEVRERQVPSKPVPTKLGPLGWSGIGAMAGGALLLGGGLTMAFLGDEHDGVVLSKDKVTTHELRPPGIGLASAGGAALIAGAVLLVLDRLKVKKSRAKSKKN